MPAWDQFANVAPRIAAVFERRHAATGGLCMLGTLRADGFPRISPMEPRCFEGAPLDRGNARHREVRGPRPRSSVHAAHGDDRPHVADGDAKVWGTVEDVLDAALHQRYAEALFGETAFDLRGRTFEHFFKAHLVGAAAVEINDGHLDITMWSDGTSERVLRKH